MNNHHTPPILILHDQAHLYLEQLQARFPQQTFTVCADPNRVQGVLERHQPEVVMSLKCDGVPGPAHRIAVHYPTVQWLQVCGAGFEHLLPLNRDDVTITNATGVLSEFMAESVIGAILMLNFGALAYLDQQRRHHWKINPWTGLVGKTALIIGLGEIGRRVATHCRYHGMQVIGMRRGNGRVAEVDESITAEDLPTALGRADVISIHVPLIDSTRNLLDRTAFAQMKPGVILVNTARGGVMDETALLDALASGQVRAAHMDVFAAEPLCTDSPLWDAQNLVITPHMMDSVSDWETRFALFFADNLQRWLAGQTLLKVVDPSRGY